MTTKRSKKDEVEDENERVNCYPNQPSAAIDTNGSLPIDSGNGRSNAWDFMTTEPRGSVVVESVRIWV